MIIGLSGYAGSGKNTVADMLGSEYRQISFAEPMREALLALNPILGFRPVLNSPVKLREIIKSFGWDSAKRLYPEVRRLLQVLGTEVGRGMFGEDFWTLQAMKHVKYGDNVVFTDVRFTNEAWAIKVLGGEVWRINRDGVSAVNNHPSESALDDWIFDRVIDNSGTLEELREKVSKCLIEN